MLRMETTNQLVYKIRLRNKIVIWLEYLPLKHDNNEIFVTIENFLQLFPFIMNSEFIFEEKNFIKLVKFLLWSRKNLKNLMNKYIINLEVKSRLEKDLRNCFYKILEVKECSSMLNTYMLNDNDNNEY